MTTATFSRPTGWSFDQREVLFGRDIFDDAFVSLDDLATPQRYGAIRERFAVPRSAAVPSAADLAPLHWAIWTVSAVLLAPALIDGRMLLIDPDELGVVSTDGVVVEHFWARPSECELRATPHRVLRVLDACLGPVADTAAQLSGIRRAALDDLVHDAVVATCTELEGATRDLAGQRARDLVGLISHGALRQAAA